MAVQNPATLSPVEVINSLFEAQFDLDSDVARSTVHPTKAKLIDTTAALLRTHKTGEITVDMVLAAAGISKGSLYHHFEDLDELIETAMLERYARWVDVSVEAMTHILTTAKAPKDIYLGLVEITKRTQDPKLSGERFYRAEVLAMASSRPRFAKQLAEIQQHLTDALTDLIRDAQDQDYYRKDIDPKAIAVFIQAYTMGKIIDDFSPNPVDPENYANLINTIIKEVFMTK
jgi:AcrR family transcriptional regulator